jgi:hypothetical protein
LEALLGPPGVAVSNWWLTEARDGRPKTVSMNFRIELCSYSVGLAVYRQEVDSLVEAVHDILDEYPPLEALRVWFLRLAGLVRVKHGLGEALQTAAAQGAARRIPSSRTSAGTRPRRTARQSRLLTGSQHYRVL